MLIWIRNGAVLTWGKGLFETRRLLEEIRYPEIYSEPNQTSKMELLVKLINGFQPLTNFAESSVLHIWLGSECASDMSSR